MTENTSVAATLQRVLIGPLLALRMRYVPLLMIYFAYGASSVTGIAETFWVRERLSLSGADLAAVSVWATVPWTLKMVIGQLVDAVPIFGSTRRVYVFLGAALCAAGYLGLAWVADATLAPAALGRVYLATQVLIACGFVLQDVTADAMTTEVVERHDADGAPRSKAEIDADLGMVQVLGRLALMVGALIAGIGGGYLAGAVSRQQSFLVGLAVPVVSILGAALVRVDSTERGVLDTRVLGGGALFGAFTVAMGYLDVPFGQEIVFLVSMAVVLGLLYVTVRGGDPASLRRIAFAALVIFVFRAMPSSGEPVSWWEMDVLGFDEEFFGHLRGIGSLVTIAVMWFGSGAVTHRPIGQVLAGLTVIGFVVSLPIIGMAYGLHEWTLQHLGFGARGIALVDVTVASPLVQLAMIPMLTLIAVNAPEGKRATWFALMASLMNLAMNAGNLGTKYLNMLLPIERGHYDRIADLMWRPTLISLVVPLVVIALVGRSLRGEPERA